MTCSFCGSRITDEERRCRKCGRKPGDTLNGEFMRPRVQGALAEQLELRPAPVSEAVDATGARAPRMREVQQSLFPGNVIQFSEYAPPQPKQRKTAKTRGPNKPRPVPDGQGSFELHPIELLPLPAAPKLLSTTVEAMLNCDFPVATAAHRALAAAIDWSFALLGYAVFLTGYFMVGGGLVLDQTHLMVLGGSLVLFAITYGVMWALLGADSAGMRIMGLRLVTFDGYPLELKQRFLRLAGSGLSLCTVLGMLWALWDEEKLTWQDHISETFPTPKLVEAAIFRRG